MDVEKLDLSEIKTLCKKYDVGFVGDKKTLIKKLKYFLDPVQDSLNTHIKVNFYITLLVFNIT